MCEFCDCDYESPKILSEEEIQEFAKKNGFECTLRLYNEEVKKYYEDLLNKLNHKPFEAAFGKVDR